MSCTFKVGKFGESYVQKLLRNAGITSRPNKAKSRKELTKWDLEADLDGREFHLEVKFDLMESQTGNVAVEYYNTRLAKPSGIAATASDLWVYVFQPLSAFVARTADLRSFCESVKPSRTIASGGDDNAALWLYSRDVILPAVFHPMDDLTPQELRFLLNELLNNEEKNGPQP